MKEDKITKRIKELQNDSKFTFKLTEDIIDLVYRTAIEDLAKDKKDPDKVYKTNDDGVIVNSSKELNKTFGSKSKWDDEKVENYVKKSKRDTYLELLKLIEKENDLMNVYVFVKEKCKEYGEPGVKNNYGRRTRENPWY